ncbi:hypothetical protein ABKS89_30300 [Pseudomonas sp. LABIM340]|uniref:hypothetical protein n=1 Tax=Pseudomonas sp. LABIM340 TaxID=3156585 RepID=UPI0032AFD988
MLTPDHIASMNAEELKAAQKDNMERYRLNSACQRFAAGACTKRTRGGSKLRAWRVAKPDSKRLLLLKAQAKDILEEGSLLAAEMRRRADAQKARA